MWNFPACLGFGCRSGGRNKPAGARGHVKRVRCEDSGVLVPKDKAVKRFLVRNIVDASAVRDMQDSSTIDGAPPAYESLFTSPRPALPMTGQEQSSLKEPLRIWCIYQVATIMCSIQDASSLHGQRLPLYWCCKMFCPIW